MPSFDKSLVLAKGMIPAVAMMVFVVARVGSGLGFMIVPFVVCSRPNPRRRILSQGD